MLKKHLFLTLLCASVAGIAVGSTTLSVRAATVTSSELDHIEIVPNDRPTRVPLGTDQHFVATGFTAENKAIAGLTFQWSAGGNIGGITKSGIFTAQRAGTGTVTATNGKIAATVGVVVKKPAAANTNAAKTTAPTNTATENGNTNAGANVNAVQEPVPPAVTETQPSAETTAQCTTIRGWLWVLILVVYSFALLLYFLWLGESTTVWWWVVPALLTAIVLVVFDRVHCPGFQRWVWPLFIIAGALLSLFYWNMLRPRQYGPAQPQTPAPRG